MLATYYQTAIKSPCHQCKAMGDPAGYPQCSEQCAPVNDYLRLLGDRPHEPDKNDDIAKKFPPQAYSQNQKHRCTEEEFKALSKQLKAKKKELKVTALKISELSGIPVYLVRTVIAGSQKKIITESYNKFIEWLEG